MTLRMGETASRAVLAVVLSLPTVAWADTALASQGPGGGMGTASHLTQLAMAILVYGTLAIVAGAGLIGAVYRR
jgi:hypothetical protein